MILSPETLVDALSKAFSHIKEEECQNVILSIGFTGSGKSTLLGSMIVGSSKMCQITKSSTI